MVGPRDPFPGVPADPRQLAHLEGVRWRSPHRGRLDIGGRVATVEVTGDRWAALTLRPACEPLSRHARLELSGALPGEVRAALDARGPLWCAPILLDHPSRARERWRGAVAALRAVLAVHSGAPLPESPPREPVDPALLEELGRWRRDGWELLDTLEGPCLRRPSQRGRDQVRLSREGEALRLELPLGRISDSPPRGPAVLGQCLLLNAAARRARLTVHAGRLRAELLLHGDLRASQVVQAAGAVQRLAHAVRPLLDALRRDVRVARWHAAMFPASTGLPPRGGRGRGTPGPQSQGPEPEDPSR